MQLQVMVKYSKNKISFLYPGQYYVLRVVAFVNCVLAHVDSIYLLLDLLSSIRQVNIDVVYVFGCPLDAKKARIIVADLLYWLFLAIVDDTLMVPDNFLEFWQSVYIK